MALFRLRKSVALWICPELSAKPLRLQIKSAYPDANAGTNHPLVTLAEALAAHQGVTHFAISMRIMGKGDFFKNMKEKGWDCRTRTASRAMAWFADNWPADLEWPRDIPRPPKSKKEAA